VFKYTIVYLNQGRSKTFVYLRWCMAPIDLLTFAKGCRPITKVSKKLFYSVYKRFFINKSPTFKKVNGHRENCGDKNIVTPAYIYLLHNFIVIIGAQTFMRNGPGQK